MKKGAIYGIIAAFIAIAMLIFLPVIAERGRAPAPAVTDTADSAADIQTSKNTDTDPATTVFVTDTDGADDTAEQTAGGTQTETGTGTTEAVTVTEEETTAEEAATTAEEITTVTEPVTTVTEEETTKAPVTTKPEEPPVTTKKEEETTKAPVTTKADTTTRKATPLDENKKYVAFTFDDGPDAVRSKAITDKMLEYGGKCTFFVVGNCIYGEREKGMQYAYNHGMEIALHCWSHEHYYTKEPQYYHDEVYKGAEAIKKSIGVWPTLMRPPGGNITEEQYRTSEFPVIIWSIDTNDWRYKRLKTDTSADIQKKVQTIVNNCLYDSNGKFQVKNGDIILMHEIYENSYDAFCIIIEELSNRGFEFVTVSELLQNPPTGYKYYSATYKKG